MEKERGKAIRILDEFEELLNEKNITIPSKDREGNKNEARLYGTEYYMLEDRITKILENNQRETKYRLFIENIKDFFEKMPMLTEEQESLLQNAYELLK